MRPRRRRKPRQGDALGVVLLALAAAAVVGAFAAAVVFAPPKLDPETLCRKGAPPARQVSVLIDATDALAPRHKRAVAAAVASERARLDPGDRLAIYALRPQDGREPALLFSLCDPGGAEAVNPWLSDAAEAERRREEAYLAPMDAALRRASAVSGGPQKSPLLDALVSVARDPDFQAAPRRRLVFASDLLEHRPEFSHYGSDAPKFALWEESPDAAGRLAPLSGAAVRIVRFDRPDHADLQEAAQEGFWAPYFAAAGAQAEFDP